MSPLDWIGWGFVLAAAALFVFGMTQVFRFKPRKRYRCLQCYRMQCYEPFGRDEHGYCACCGGNEIEEVK